MENNTPFPTPPKPYGSGPIPPPQQPSDSGSVKTLKIIAVILGIALIASLIVLYSVWSGSNELKAENETVIVEKDRVTADLEQLKSEYGDLRTSNDTLNNQLDQERKKIDLLLDKIKKTDYSNRNKLKEYEGEITNLRGLLKSYVSQIDELSAKNKELMAENERVKGEYDQTKQKAEALEVQAGNLKTMVEKGAEMKVRDITAVALNNRDKTVSKARQAEQIKVCLTIVENSIAKMGTHYLYIRVKTPDGSLLTDSTGNLFDPVGGGSQMIYSVKREVDYNGQDLDVCLFYKDSELPAGNYNIEVYLDGNMVGTSLLVLK